MTARAVEMDFTETGLSKPAPLDDDGRPKRTGDVWTASAHIITAVIGSGVLSLAWSVAQLGWIAGPLTLILFALVTYYTSAMLADCYRTFDPVSGKRNYTYMEAVNAYLGGMQVWLCGLCQYVNLFGTGVGYTITAALSAAALKKTYCFQHNGRDADCKVSTSFFIIGYGIIQIFLSQITNFHKLWWLSYLASTMSFIYSFIAVGLSVAKIISGNTGRSTLTGTVVGIDVDASQKIWQALQALGNIAFAYSYSMILIEIQDTLKSPPQENKVMKKATVISVLTTTLFYVLCGCLGYAAFGNNAPGNILSESGFSRPYWLLDLANVCVVVHLVGSYQVYCQPLFALVEISVLKRWPNSRILAREHHIIGKNNGCTINVFRLVWRTVFVIVTTLLSIMMPFFNDVLGFLGAMGFWPLTVYIPIEMYIKQKKIRRFTTKWIVLQSISGLCCIVTIAATCASVEGIVVSFHNYKPFQTET